MKPTDQQNHSDWISVDRVDFVESILRQVGWLSSDERIERLDLAGQGNMNCTLRASTTSRSVVIKQARPWVEKYPSIAAPVERALYEIKFYESVQKHAHVAERMPKLIGADPDQYLLVLEDVGVATDGTRAYNRLDTMSDFHEEVVSLIEWLRGLHESTRGTFEPSAYRNLALRKLNHAHLFQVPFDDPPAIDLDAITPGLREVAAKVASNDLAMARIEQLGNKYLSDGDWLLHGDFFPGSWLFASSATYVIDPEFCFAGPREFDLAVAAAHLELCEFNSDPVRWLIDIYQADGARLDHTLVRHWAAVEVLRRLLGVAQLPIARTLDQKTRMIHRAIETLTR